MYCTSSCASYGASRMKFSSIFTRDERVIHYESIHMTHSHLYTRHDSFICVTWLIHMCCMTIHVCDMTHSYVWRDSSVSMYVPAPTVGQWCKSWLVHLCDMTHSHVWHDALMCVTWHIHMYDMAHSYVVKHILFLLQIHSSALWWHELVKIRPLLINVYVCQNMHTCIHPCIHTCIYMLYTTDTP